MPLSGLYWRSLALLDEHRILIQEELAEVQSGSRKLQAHDFLGPMETEKQKASTKARELVVSKKQEMKMDTFRNNKLKEPENKIIMSTSINSIVPC